MIRVPISTSNPIKYVSSERKVKAFSTTRPRWKFDNTSQCKLYTVKLANVDKSLISELKVNRVTAWQVTCVLQLLIWLTF